ncbi:MAG: hypothetical protein NVS2B7_38420 [Herpetosiphon sp.]
MSIAQAIAQIPILVPDRIAMHTDLEATRSAYHHLLDTLSDDDLSRPCVVSRWTVKEVLCHLVLGVEQTTPMMVQRARKSKPMPKMLNTRFGHWMNYQMAVRAARKATRESLGQRYDVACAGLLELLNGVRDDQWSLPTAYPDGTPLTLETVFHVPTDHFALHMGWIHQTLNRA